MGARDYKISRIRQKDWTREMFLSFVSNFTWVSFFGPALPSVFNESEISENMSDCCRICLRLRWELSEESLK